MSSVQVCDSCKDRQKPAKQAALYTGHLTPDPAGGAATEELRFVDLCLDCAITALERQCRAGVGYRP